MTLGAHSHVVKWGSQNVLWAFPPTHRVTLWEGLGQVPPLWEDAWSAPPTMACTLRQEVEVDLQHFSFAELRALSQPVFSPSLPA